MDEIREEIERVARDLYLKSGCLEGHDMENWLIAEDLVLSWHLPYDERERHVGAHERLLEDTRLDPDQIIH